MGIAERCKCPPMTVVVAGITINACDIAHLLAFLYQFMDFEFTGPSGG